MEPEKTEPPRPVPDTPPEQDPYQPLQLDPILPEKKRKKYPFIILFILLLAGMGLAAYKIGAKKPAPEVQQTNNEQEQQPANSTEKDVVDSTETKEFSNGFLGIKLTYPANWTATESANTDSVKLESPNFSYQTKSKGLVTGNFRVYVRKGARSVDGTYIGRGYAFEPSEKLTYTKPALGQRADTYLTHFGLDKPDNFGFFLIAGNYNLKKGDTLGPDYGKEAETYIIAGGFSSKDLKDDLATNAVDTELLQTSNAYKQALGVLKSLQLR